MHNLLNGIIKPGDSTASFHLNDLSRGKCWILHQMSLFYFIEVEELAGNTTRVFKRYNFDLLFLNSISDISCKPHMLLSEACRIYFQQTNNVATAENWPSNSCIVFYDFSPYVKFYNLQSYLTPWVVLIYYYFQIIVGQIYFISS